MKKNKLKNEIKQLSNSINEFMITINSKIENLYSDKLNKPDEWNSYLLKIIEEKNSRIEMLSKTIELLKEDIKG